MFKDFWSVWTSDKIDVTDNSNSRIGIAFCCLFSFKMFIKDMFNNETSVSLNQGVRLRFLSSLQSLCGSFWAAINTVAAEPELWQHECNYERNQPTLNAHLILHQSATIERTWF